VNGKAVFVEVVVKKTGEGDGRELREMRGQADGVVVLLRTEPRADVRRLFREFREGRDARILFSRRLADESVGVSTKKIGVGMGDAGEFRPAIGWPPRKSGPLAAG